MTTYHPSQQAADPATTDTHEDGHGRIDRMRERAATTGASIDRQARAALDDGTQFVRENPGLALAGAFCFGLVLGLGARARA